MLDMHSSPSHQQAKLKKAGGNIASFTSQPGFCHLLALLQKAPIWRAPPES